MKALLEVARFDVADVITASGEVECALPEVPAPVGNAPEQACPGGA
ncbi:MAG: hypothetical protein J6J13_02290 [Clostridia bacterium]|nr:hypothetical protein [Clostridia bacterium]